MGALVRLAAYHPQVIGPDLEKVVRLLMVEYKNPRSQVTRAALQASTILFRQLGGKANSLKAGLIFGHLARNPRFDNVASTTKE